MTCLGALLFCLAGVFIGWQMRDLWLEKHHHCMPHDPQNCKKDSGK